MLTGSLVAIATPMRTGGALDLPALGRLIDFHVENGTAGIVVVGTTGESPTVDVDEHCSLIKSAVEFARGRIPVIAGTGGNATSEAIALTEFAKKAGAQSGLSVLGMIVPLPFFTGYALGLLLIAYLILLAGVLVDNL